MRRSHTYNWLPGGLLLSALAPFNSAQAQFQAGFEAPGASGGVYALATHNTGTGPRLYAGGDFTSIGTTSTPGIARWEPSTNTWAPLQSGITGRVAALLAHHDGSPPFGRLIVAGAFTTAGTAGTQNIARWTGSSWQALAGGMDDWVLALAEFDEDGAGPNPPVLYAGGIFEHAGGVPANGIARWNGASWQALGLGLNGPVTSMVALDPDGPAPQPSRLIVGGLFTHSGTQALPGLASWSGSAWSSVGGGVSGSAGTGVTALTLYDEDGAGGAPARLYLGGAFTQAGTVPANNIARWDGNSFTALGSGLEATSTRTNIRALTVFDDGLGPQLYVAGLFRSAGGLSATPTTSDPEPFLISARWNGLTQSWSLPTSGANDNTNGVARALAVYDHDINGFPSLFIGGQFSGAGTGAATGIARLNGSVWQPLSFGNGMNAEVHCMRALSPGSPQVYVGGAFTTAGTTLANRIALWDDTSATWSSLGAGFDGPVHALGFTGSTLVAGGKFEQSGVLPVNNIAKLEGSSWVPLGQGLDGDVLAIEEFQGQLYAGGSFEDLLGSGSNISRFDGSSSTWTALPSGLEGLEVSVRALAFFQEPGQPPSLIVAGDFQAAGGQSANAIARWDGVTWSPMGAGLCCGGVYDLEVFNGALYAAGTFEVEGSQRPAGIKRWNPTTSTWDALGSGFFGGNPTRARALANSVAAGAPSLVIGGDFTLVDGMFNINNIVRFNGTTFSPVGVGLGGVVNAIAAVPGPGSTQPLFVGGSFTHAGTTSPVTSSHIARTN